VLVATIIAWPELVTHFLDEGTGVDPTKVLIQVAPTDEPPPIIDIR